MITKPKKLLIILLFIVFFSSGCSLIPRITFDKKSTVPQQTQKTEKRVRCSGPVTINDMGIVTSCEKGYRFDEKIFNQKERKSTLKEKIINFLSGLMGWGFWIFLGLLIFAPGVLGFVVGKIVEGIFGISTKALKATVVGIDKAKKNGGDFTKELALEHSKDKKIKAEINKIRAEVT